MTAPRGVALDPAAGRIYWANYDTNAISGSISYANLNGNGGGSLVTTGAPLDEPLGVALDPATGKIYWTDFDPDLGDESISYANLNGSGGGDVTQQGFNGRPFGVALDSGARRIYGADPGGISFTNLNGSGSGYLTVPYTDNAFVALLKLPAAAGAPQVTGGSALGSVLSCSHGSWAPNLIGSFLYRAPHTFAYGWTVNGAAISGASGSTYTATEPGDYRCRVTASNAAGGTSQTSAPHTVTPRPSVSRFSPASGVAGSTVVTITGSNLAGASTVKFNGLTARINSDAATQITATVPTGATTGKITVTTPGGTATSASSFAVTFTLNGCRRPAAQPGPT